jgi:hypothetical protein
MMGRSDNTPASQEIERVLVLTMNPAIVPRKHIEPDIKTEVQLPNVPFAGAVTLQGLLVIVG